MLSSLFVLCFKIGFFMCSPGCPGSQVLKAKLTLNSKTPASEHTSLPTGIFSSFKFRKKNRLILSSKIGGSGVNKVHAYYCFLEDFLNLYVK